MHYDVQSDAVVTVRHKICSFIINFVMTSFLYFFAILLLS